MNVRTLMKWILGGAALGAATSAATAVSGAMGAITLEKSGYDEYSIPDGARTGAVGGAIVGTCMGSYAAISTSFGLFANNRDNRHDDNTCSCFIKAAVGYVGASVIGGLVGYGVMQAAHVETIMDVAQTAATFAVGGAVSMVPVAAIAVCLGLACGTAIGAALHHTPDSRAPTTV